MTDGVQWSWAELQAYAQPGEQWLETEPSHVAVLVARAMNQEREAALAAAEAAPAPAPAPVVDTPVVVSPFPSNE